MIVADGGVWSSGIVGGFQRAIFCTKSNDLSDVLFTHEIGRVGRGNRRIPFDLKTISGLPKRTKSDLAVGWVSVPEGCLATRRIQLTQS